MSVVMMIDNPNGSQEIYEKVASSVTLPSGGRAHMAGPRPGGGWRVIEVGRLRLHAIHTPGHTAGSTCFTIEGSPVLLSGDTLFPGGPGNTEKDPDRFGRLMDDLERKVFGPLPDETWVYPGHGDDTTLGAERPHLAEWRVRGW